MRRRRSNPTILVDATDIDRPSGARTAVYELLREMVQQAPTWEFRVLLSAAEPELNFPNVRQIIVPVRNRVLERIWVQVVVTALTLTRSVDLVHFARTLGGIAWPVPSVLTIFDLTTLVHPELHHRYALWYWRFVVPVHLRAASHIIAISENVAHDLESYYRISGDKVSVMYCAPQRVFDVVPTDTKVESCRALFSLPDRYLLFVGMLAKKKNLTTLLQALFVLRERGLRQNLVLVGRRYSQSDDVGILNLVATLGLESQVQYLGPVEATYLPALYRGADMLVFPSLHEGFGIPCVEAMKCGLPVIAVRSGAIPEIVGDAAVLIDSPLDPGAFADAIQALLGDKTLQSELAARGLRQAERYMWPALARKTTRLFRGIMGY